LIGGREHDDPEDSKRFVAADLAENLEAVHFWHFDIEEEEVGQRIFVPVGELAGTIEISQAFFAIANYEQRVVDAGFIKGAANEYDIVFKILREEDDGLLAQSHAANWIRASR
jgi:hypothetical protein